MATSFSEAMERAPLRAFQVATFVICMLVLTCDGIDQQLLGIIAPKVIADFAVDKGTFGIAMSASLVGFGLGAWSGGWLGDAVGRRWSLAIAAAVFALATAGASLADGVWPLAMWRVVGGLTSITPFSLSSILHGMAATIGSSSSASQRRRSSARASRSAVVGPARHASRRPSHTGS